MAHHPHLEEGAVLPLAMQLRAVASTSSAVHAAAITIILLQLTGFVGFCRLLGPHRPVVTAGLVAWVAGSFALILAAVVNGFTLPWLGYSAIPDDQLRTLVRFGWTLNQVLTALGLNVWAGAVALWAIALAREPGPVAKGVAVIAGASALVAGIGIATGLARASGTSFIVLMSGFALWTALAGALIISDELSPRNMADGRGG